jgi:Asp/Glu/hydantoin racemase
MSMQHDKGLEIAMGRPGQLCSGMGLGVLLLDDEYPGFPGDVRNASGFPYPVQYEIVEGVDIHLLNYSGDERERAFEPILKAAQRLKRIGAKAIVGECGHFSLFQKRLADALDIPVFISSLLQVSWAKQVIGNHRMVGVVVSHTEPVTDNHLDAVGIVKDDRIAICGARNDGKCPAFDSLWIAAKREDPPRVIYADAEAQLVKVCTDFAAEHPNMGAMVLECTGFPPFARAVQRAVDMPVYSYATLMDFAWSAVAHRDFYGHV